MRRIIYDVAVSIDGFIAGYDGDISGFLPEGEHVEAYLARLGSYSTVIMGRGTYEFGYDYGMAPGDLAYPHMDHHVFSRSIELPTDSRVQVVRETWEQALADLKSTEGGDIYLCGGGLFAGFVAQLGLLDRLRLKVSPVLLGGGTPIFAGLQRQVALRLLDSRNHASGVAYAEYEVERTTM